MQGRPGKQGGFGVDASQHQWLIPFVGASTQGGNWKANDLNGYPRESIAARISPQHHQHSAPPTQHISFQTPRLAHPTYFHTANEHVLIRQLWWVAFLADELPGFLVQNRGAPMTWDWSRKCGGCRKFFFHFFSQEPGT